MDESSKPRINGAMLSSCVGKFVCVVGKNLGTSPDGLSLSVEMSDGQRIEARFPQRFQDTLDPYVELLGKVERDCSLSIQRVVNFGADFDLEAYNEVVQLTGSFPDLFTHTTSTNPSMDF